MESRSCLIYYGHLKCLTMNEKIQPTVAYINNRDMTNGFTLGMEYPHASALRYVLARDFDCRHLDLPRLDKEEQSDTLRAERNNLMMVVIPEVSPGDELKKHTQTIETVREAVGEEVPVFFVPSYVEGKSFDPPPPVNTIGKSPTSL